MAKLIPGARFIELPGNNHALLALAGTPAFDQFYEEATNFLATHSHSSSWLLAGWTPVDDMAELLKIAQPGRRDNHTVAGFALAQLGRFPRLGNAFEFGTWRFEVIDIDGRRIDKVLAQSLRKPVITR